MITIDELTVWTLFISAMLILVAIGVLLYCCALLIDVRHRVRELRPPEVERGNGDWPNEKRQVRR